MEEEVIETNRKLRQVLVEFFDDPTDRIAELVYGSEGKTYKAETILPILQQILDRFKTCFAVFKADCADAYFTQKVIHYITHVFAAFSSEALLHSFASVWVY